MSSSANQPIVLFDLPSRVPCKCWSLNPWKARLILNYKNIDYTTEWVEYPDIKSRLENYVAPNTDGPSEYTIPTIKLPDGIYIMDSKKIATHLETVYPTPSLHLDSPYLSKMEALLAKVMMALRPAYFTNVPARILNEASIEYWTTTRSKRVGMPLDEYAKKCAKMTPEEIVNEARTEFEELSKMYGENQDGPFVMGKEVSHADFMFVGFLCFIESVDEGTYERILQVDREAFQGLHDACEKWLARAD